MSSEVRSNIAMNPKDRENQLIDKAISLAESQLEDGTASSQVITHFLKLATEREKLEREKLRNENELLKSKKVSIDSQQDLQDLFKQAIDSMRQYQGTSDLDDYDEDSDYDEY